MGFAAGEAIVREVCSTNERQSSSLLKTQWEASAEW